MNTSSKVKALQQLEGVADLRVGESDLHTGFETLLAASDSADSARTGRAHRRVGARNLFHGKHNAPGSISSSATLRRFLEQTHKWIRSAIDRSYC